jgi:hypothetical protein
MFICRYHAPKVEAGGDPREENKSFGAIWTPERGSKMRLGGELQAALCQVHADNDACGLTWPCRVTEPLLNRAISFKDAIQFSVVVSSIRDSLEPRLSIMPNGGIIHTVQCSGLLLTRDWRDTIKLI